MLIYLIQMSTFWVIAWLFFYLILSKETFHQWNRFYLLSVIFLGIGLPLFKIASPIAIMPTYLLPEAFVTATTPASATPITDNSLSFSVYLKIVYLLGVLLTSLSLAKEIYTLLGLKQRAKVEIYPDYTWVQATTIDNPFSFFHFIFWNKSPCDQDPTHQYILKHELAHIRQWHSLDKLFLSLLSILLWWHPMIYVFKYALNQIHEFIADEAAIQAGNKRTYGKLLLFHATTTQIVSPLANTFINPPIKNRIIMLLQPMSPPLHRWKYLGILPLLAIVFFACQPEGEGIVKKEDLIIQDYLIDTIITFDPKTYEESMTLIKTPFYKEVDEMPIFGECKGLIGEALTECSNMKLFTYIYSNIKYPQAARQQKIEGTTVAKFVVRSEGYIENLSIVNSLSPEIDAEVIKVIEGMPKWIPGKKDGEAVNVQYILPVNFKLE